MEATLSLTKIQIYRQIIVKVIFTLFIIVATLVSLNAQSVRVKVLNGLNQDETLISFNDMATTGIDRLFDALKVFHPDASVPQIYSVSEGVSYSINTLPNQKDMLKIELKVKTPAMGTYILYPQIIGIDDYDVFIEDKLTNRKVKLTNSDLFEFNNELGDTVFVFSITFSLKQKGANINTEFLKLSNGPKSEIDSFSNHFFYNHTTALVENNISNQSNIYSTNGTLHIIGINGNVSVFTINGQLLHNFDDNETELHIPINSGNVYVITVSNNNEHYSKKVLGR